MIKHRKQNNMNLNYYKERPPLYNITFSSMKIDEEKFKNILLSHFYYKEETIDMLFKDLNLKRRLSIGKYTKDIAETKLGEINNGISFEEEDLNVMMTINNQ